MNSRPAEKPKTGRYTFTVQDDGIGMSEEYLPHIFEEFTREHTSTESKVIGTGLGLPIVKALVEWMHGSIDVQSKLGAGTTVTITLGFPLADEAQKSVEEQDAEGDAAQLKGCRILLAEDNDLNAEIAQTLLEDEGAEVTLVTDGKQAVERFQSESPRTKLYVQSVFPVNDSFKKYAAKHGRHDADIVAVNKGLQALCAEKGIVYIDLWTLLADKNGKLRADLTNDGLHLMGEGYIVWRDAVLPYVK